MDVSSSKYLFQRRNERIDWRKLAAVDVDKIARDVDVDAIQENIVNVTYCNVEHELGGYQELDANVLKLFRLAQLTIEYLLHSQDFLQQCLVEKDRKVEDFEDQLRTSISQCGEANGELVKRNESYKNLKKELQKARKLIGDYQVMVRSGASGLYKCTSCTKTFVSEYYLKSHIERRHSDGKQPMPMKEISVNPPNRNGGHEEILNELDGIKVRLKATEEELRKERENVYQLNLKESDRSRELLDLLKLQKNQKVVEQEEIKAEMEGYKNMMMKELKESRRENETLQKMLSNLQESTENWKNNSRLGDLEDDEGGRVYTDLSSQVKDLTNQLVEAARENEKLKESNEKWKSAYKKLKADLQQYEELDEKIGKFETLFLKQIDSLSSKYQEDIEDAKTSCQEALNSMNQKKNLTAFYASDVVDAKKPLRSPRPVETEPEHVILWISSNSTIANCHRVSQSPASSKGDWMDGFSFQASLTRSEGYNIPVYVFSCGGSPYWRQYISLSDQPPTPSYKKEFTFYASASKFTGSIKLFIMNIGSNTVIRSQLSKRENVDGWGGKGENFHVFLPKNSLNRSSTLYSDPFGSVSDDDEVSLSSLTGTDAARENLAESLRMNRENVVEDEVFDEEEGDETEPLSEKGNEENENFNGTSSTSFLATLPERGEFYPFPDNLLAVAKYNHSPNMINAQREEILSILDESLSKRGVDSDEGRLAGHIYSSKMKNHQKELNLIEKKNHGCLETRKRLSDALEEYAKNENRPKRGKGLGSFSSLGKVVKAAVRFSDEIQPDKEESKVPAIDISPSQSRTGPIIKGPPPPAVIPPSPSHHPILKETVEAREPSEVSGLDDSSSEWNSDELEQQLAEPISNSTRIADNTATQKDTAHSPQRHPSQDVVQSFTVGKDNLDVDESDWSDTEELSPDQPRPVSAGFGSNDMDDSFEEYEEPYMPNLRPPTGDKVKALTASLELSLNSRDPSKKMAGAVDLHQV